MNDSKQTHGPFTDVFAFDKAHCWLDLARVTRRLSSAADRELVHALSAGGRLPPADVLLERLCERKATPGLITNRGEWVEIMKVAIDKADCKCRRPHFTEFAARVEARIKEIQPIWDDAIDMVEVTETTNTSAGSPPPWFLYYHADAWTLIEHIPLRSLDRVVLNYPGAGTTVTLDLEGDGTTRRLSLSIPADARRAELMYLHTESGPAPDRTPMAETLNQRPDGDIELLLAVSVSPVPIPLPAQDALPAYPAYTSNLWDIDASVRAAGLYDLDADRRNIAVRLCQDWLRPLNDLRSVVSTLMQ